MSASDRRRQRRLLGGLALTTAVLAVAGLAAGSDGWSPAGLATLWNSPDAALILGRIRAPRTVGAWLVGALLGLAGASAQGLFRNPIADPYLLGSASGATLGVVAVLAFGAPGAVLATAAEPWRLGLVGAAFVGALLGVVLTLMLARGAQQTTRLLLAGVVVGVVLAAASDLLTSAAPEALRGRQAFMLGSTALLGWDHCAVLGAGLALVLPLTWRLARVLDVLTLGTETARSLGLDLARARLALVVLLALATGIAVSQAGLIAFIGLVAPHLVRRFAPGTHDFTLLASSAAGGTLLLLSDVFARSLMAPQEVPVGVLSALFGGAYLMWLLRRRSDA